MRQPTLKNPEKEPEIQTTQQVASVQFRDLETVYLECSWEHHGVGQAQEKAPGAISSGEGGKGGAQLEPAEMDLVEDSDTSF